MNVALYQALILLDKSFPSSSHDFITTSAPCIIRILVNDLILIVLGAIPFPRSKRSIQAALWLVCGSGGRIPYITQLRADA